MQGYPAVNKILLYSAFLCRHNPQQRREHPWRGHWQGMESVEKPLGGRYAKFSLTETAQRKLIAQLEDSCEMNEVVSKPSDDS